MIIIIIIIMSITIIIVSLLDISRDAKSLIKGLLTVDQNRRLTIDQAISHPWYINVNDNFI
jgi:serine/threonine protein kinase